MSHKSNTLLATIAGIGSAGLVFLGMVTCCGMPLLAGILATIGVGASQLNFLAKYQGVFMGIAIVSLMFGFYQAYFARKSSCCGGTPTNQKNCCLMETDESAATPKSSRFQQFQKIFLWIGAIIVGAALVFSGNKGVTESTTKEDRIFNPSDDFIVEESSTSCCP
ncbi:MAG: hypothetical protein ACRC10_00895 [Thermoguttaceae bacterium]